ncbi:PP2C family protein-serine/threonine phosphatase [Gryllotalpicola protaetiae]|uniref:Serine/threonine-protein phosphatase n=1 Tax=Gryllotalpicola protaetiae TaxID=2419771 RepID=A0A387BL41_9MICO|nr:protein phosphatase 2C domain-containing protein [Gryllotalpicola protaetiae]AYG03062.1 serine/threonine-protein phosphatase [Gryllotalpicola protaetiae]
MPHEIDVSAHSAVGRVRSINEDSFLASDPLFFVADGMGGHAFGDRASQAAVAALADRVPAGSEPSPDDVLEAVVDANLAVRALSTHGEIGLAVAGTTLAGVARVLTETGPHWMVVNVGDSRVYSWDGRELTQLTVDHSAVQELVDRGVITEEQAARHPERNVITRALGADDEIEADVWVLPYDQVRTFLICTDGLTKLLTTEMISGILAGDVVFGAEAEGTIAQQLVEAADLAGGYDNITAIVIESHASDAGGDADQTHERGLGVLEETRPRG